MVRTNKQLFCICLAFIIIMLLSGNALAGPAAQQVATGGAQAEQRFPSLSGSTLVWTDNRSGNQNVYQIDLTTQTVSPVIEETANQNNPQTDGGKIVWTDYRQGAGNLLGQNIYMKDLVSGEITRVNKGSYLTPDFSAVSGNRVFWQARDTLTPSFTHIYFRDLTPGAPAEKMIGGKIMDQVHPVASGNRVAWTDLTPTGAKDVEVYDFGAGKASLVTDVYGDQFNPALDGDLVVWEDTRDGNSDIYLKNLSAGNGKEEPIATGPASQHNPSISGNLVTWLEGANIIKLKNLNSGIIVTLVSDPSTKSSVKVDDAGWLVWEDDRNGNPDLYGIDLSPGRPRLNLSATRFYWASFQDYQSGLLSAEFRVANSSSLPAYDLQITNARNTSGVSTASRLPQLIGDLAPSSVTNFTLVFSVPEGTGRFSTALTATCRDGAANMYQFPE